MATELMSCTAPPEVRHETMPEDRWQRLRQFQALVDDELEKTLKLRHGLSLSEYSALAALEASTKDGLLRQQVLAEAIPLRQSSATRLVERLEKQGLSRRYLCEDDRRGVYTQVTDKGLTLLTAARVDYVRTLERLRGELVGHPRFGQLVSLLEAP